MRASTGRQLSGESHGFPEHASRPLSAAALLPPAQYLPEAGDQAGGRGLGHVPAGASYVQSAASFFTPDTICAGVSVVSMGYPGPVLAGRPIAEPRNLGRGWVGFDFARGFGCPVKVINDAAMQALGSYK